MEQYTPTDHMADTVTQHGRLYQQHEQRTLPIRRFATGVTAALARPEALVGIGLLILA